MMLVMMPSTKGRVVAMMFMLARFHHLDTVQNNATGWVLICNLTKQSRRVMRKATRENKVATRH
jgi:hypothetical protein